MATLFTSDLHLGHTNIIAATGRPYSSVGEMNADLIHRWNKKVSANDEVYILGDLSYRSSVHIGFYLDQMKGRKHLIIGNHDSRWMKNVADMGKYFESVAYMDMIKRGKSLLTLCHYPMLEWCMSRYSECQETAVSWLIHGHIHNDKSNAAYRYIQERLPCALNAGVDINNYEPVTFEELLANNNSWYGKKEGSEESRLL